MTVRHFEILVEELSMEAFLSGWLPSYLPEDRTFQIHSFRGKSDLMKKVVDRLRGYQSWLPEDWRIIVLVDRDSDDCRELKDQLEAAFADARLSTRRTEPGNWRGGTCIAIEELEAWYFGDWEAVRGAYPQVSPHVPKNPRYRQPDQIAGGTWEAFERVMQRGGMFAGGLQKVGAAREISQHIFAERNRSQSFRYFARLIAEAAALSRNTGL